MDVVSACLSAVDKEAARYTEQYRGRVGGGSILREKPRLYSGSRRLTGASEALKGHLVVQSIVWA